MYFKKFLNGKKLNFELKKKFREEMLKIGCFKTIIIKLFSSQVSLIFIFTFSSREIFHKNWEFH